MDNENIYQHLEQGNFRLLKPGQGDELAFELVHCRLEEAPKYTALSYRCSEVKAECSILVNSIPFQVGQNLYDACCRFKRYILRDGSHLWADAICISQSDSEERSQQVQLMRYIYEKAYKVYVWLGWPDNPELARLGVEHMRYLNKLLQKANQEHDGDSLGGLTTISGMDKQVFDEDSTSETYRAWEGIIAVCSVDWWHRAWVYQEASTPEPEDREKTYFFYGSHCVVWYEISAAVAVALHLGQIRGLDTSIGDLGAAQSLLTFWIDREAHPMYFLSLLNHFRIASSTDPRDKVYVPLGLAQDVDHHTLLPDYRKGTVDVFTEVAKSILSRPGRELDFLGYVTRGVEDSLFFQHDLVSGLPTWVPDWTFRERIHTFSKAAGSTQQRDCQISEYNRLYNADKGRSGIIEVSGKALQVHGFCLDTIGEMSPFIEDRAKVTVLKGWKPASLQGQAAEDAVTRSLVADITYNMADEPYRGNKVEWSLVLASPDLLTADENGKKDRMMFALGSATFGRRLCFTERGRIGLIPAGARLGDQIAVFFGGQMLYVVRRLPEETLTCEHHLQTMQTFEFVGECYIDGLMDGEAVLGNVAESCIRLI